MVDTRLDLLRHGQCEGGEIFRGSSDVLLTPEGRAAMEAQIQARRDDRWNGVVSSPLKRCYHFAEATAARLSLPLIVEPDLREMHFGDWEQRRYDELWKTHPQLLKDWGDDPERYTPPGGEPLAVFADRVMTALDRLASQHNGQRLLLITHGGVIRLLLTRAHQQPRGLLRGHHVPYAHYVSLRWKDGHLSEGNP